MTKRAVLYLRLSVAVGDGVSDSIARQKADLRQLAKREGWEVVATPTDDGISGRKSRAKAVEALRMLRDGEADVLAVWKLDRWSRQGLGAVGDLVATLDATPGALFVALQDGLRSDQTAWRLVAAVLSEVARTEADNTSLRVRAANKSNRAVGRFVGGTVPFGYRAAARAEGGRTLLPHAPEVAVIREVADRILGRESQAAILADLTARKIPTTRSKRRIAEIGGLPDESLESGSWSYAGLASVWTGESLLGRISHSRTESHLEGTKIVTTKVWELVRDADGLPLTAYPPLLDFATVEKLRLYLRDPKNPASRRGPARPRRARLLSGVLFCAECDQRLWVTVSGGRTVYACQRRAGRCSGPNIKAENAERAVTEAFLAVAGSWDEVEHVEKITAPKTKQGLADVAAAIREATSELAADGADGPAILRRVDLLKARRAELQSIPSATTTSIVATGRTVAEAWAGSNDDARRQMLLTALDHVTLSATASKGHTGYHPERVSIVWNS